MERLENIITNKHNNYYEKISYQRWTSYFWQIYLVLKFSPQKILEIGVGDSIVSEIIKKIGYDVHTCDISLNLNPDVVADVKSLPFKKESFDLAACFQVLEHIEYGFFMACLKSLHYVVKHYVILSLPQRRKYFHFKCRFPWMRQKQYFELYKEFVRYPKYTKPASRNHFWEIDITGYPLHKIKSDIEKGGFNILLNRATPENCYHRFFILGKK